MLTSAQHLFSYSRNFSLVAQNEWKLFGFREQSSQNFPKLHIGAGCSIHIKGQVHVLQIWPRASLKTAIFVIVCLWNLNQIFLQLSSTYSPEGCQAVTRVKGQLFSKGLFKAFICTKKRTKIFSYCCPSL